jgi:voltage-gated sodium channel
VIFYVPGIGTMAGILGIARVFRVLRLATALPRLQMIVGALIKSIPSVTYVGVLLTILFFIYGVIGCILFGEVTPDKFGNLHKSMITLAQIITLEGWTAVMEAQKNPLIAAPYFLSFILVGTMIVLNLFIGVILMGFEEVNEEMLEEKAKQDKHTATTEIGEINHDLDQIKQKLIKLSAEIRVSQNKNKTK